MENFWIQDPHKYNNSYKSASLIRIDMSKKIKDIEVLTIDY